jgi:hypothetical protein
MAVIMAAGEKGTEMATGRGRRAGEGNSIRRTNDPIISPCPLGPEGT